MSYDDVSALILAGGQSRRFGSDKARHRVEGRPMVERVFEAASCVARPVRLSVGAETPPFPLDAEHVRDWMLDAGPLAGLHAGLLASEKPWLLVAACDLPFVTAEVLALLLAARDPETDAVVAQTPDGRRHPHCACYHRRVLPLVEEQLEARRLALRALLSRLSVRTVDVPAAPLRNINHRHDLEPSSSSR